MKYKSGDSVEVEIWNPDLSTSEWKQGVFQSYVAAMDRDYRCNIRLSDGRTLREVAPECVRKSPF